MRSSYILSLLFLLAWGFVCAAQTDSTSFAALDAKLENYFNALETESLATKVNEADFMIGSCDEGEVRNHVALKIYRHYLDSPIMGDESVAVHITDSWFIPAKARMSNEIDLMNAQIFADFNRRSLLGCHAPSLRLTDLEGDEVEVLGLVQDSLAAGSGRLRVLFFYDTDCAKCQVETVMLRSMFRQLDCSVDFIAVYTGSDREHWEKFMKSSLDFELKSSRLFNYWDPQMLSDFQRKYGVLQTPKLFLLARDATVLGRNLDARALFNLLEAYASSPEMTYGDSRSNELFSAIFPEDDRSLASDSVRSVASYVCERTLVQTKDTLNFKQLTGDMLYYLVGKRGEAFSYGAAYVADNLVLSRPGIWNTSDDSLKVVGLAQMVSGMVSRLPLGSSLPRIAVPGVMESRSGQKSASWTLSKLKSGTFLLFYTNACPHCQEELSAARRLARISGKRVLLVDMDYVSELDSLLTETLLDSFDLSTLPFALEVGKGRRVCRKYITLADIQN